MSPTTANGEHTKSGQAISPNPLRQARSWLSKASKDKNWILLGILALGAYLRLWNIHHLFNVISDFDEGIYSLAARFMSQGYLPYQDFTFVHPPLYPLTLASIYKIFGYDFFYGKYLSVVLSLASIALIYLVGRKMHHTGTGLAAAALFAVSTEMVYFGRRCVQESMGIFLILVAIYFAFDFINNGKNNRLFFCGLFLGLTLATKYLFIPAVAAIIIGIILISTGKRFWRPIKTLGRASFWVVYLCTATIILAILLLLKWVMKFDISIPFFNPLYFSVDDIAVSILIFAFPVIISLRMLAGRLPFKEWWLRLWGIRHSKTLWLLLGATALGFVVITGFFWIKTPQEFIYQTILIQQNRPHDFLSLVTIIQRFVMSPGFLKMSSLPIVLSIPLILVILNKRSFSWSDCFLSMALIVSLVLCQGFYHLPRYYASLLPFLLLGLASLIPPVDMQTLTASLQSVTFRIKAGFLILVAFFFLFLSISIILLTNYSGYDISDPWLASSEEYVYGETVDYLESAGAKKIYAVNPIFLAMFPNLNSTTTFDTFALLWLEKKPPEEIITDMIDEGVDYVVIDPFLDWWTYPWNKQAQELALAIRRNARLIRVIAPEPDSPCTAEIYLLGAEKQCMFNGQFDQWVQMDEMSLPLGWDSVLVAGEGDQAIIENTYINGVKCAGFIIHEDGIQYEEYHSTHAGIIQKILFPETEIKALVFPTANTLTTGQVVIGPGIHFMDDFGHALIIGFSDEVDGEEAFSYADGNRILVVKEAQLNQWSECSIDLSAYWGQTNWWQPREIDMMPLVSTHYTEPGYYTFYVASIETADARTGADGP